MTRTHLTVGVGVLTLAFLTFAPLREPAPLPTTADEAARYARTHASDHLAWTPDAVRCAPATDEAAAAFECDVTGEGGEQVTLFVLRGGPAR
ncbi:MAG: hypothetical protein H6704_28585 [Myxococcales bacterium]|nr:hypothetical protein [Myxococcales bacterium]